MENLEIDVGPKSAGATCYFVEKVEAVDREAFVGAGADKSFRLRISTRFRSATGDGSSPGERPETFDVTPHCNDPVYAKRLYDVINGVVPVPAPAPVEEDEPTSGSD